MTGSMFADTRLFFRHEPFQRDPKRFAEMLDVEKATAWRKAEKRRIPYGLPDKWDDTEVNDMGTDPMATVSGGIAAMGCPFAWLLA